MTGGRSDRLTLAAFTVVIFLGGINFVAVRFSNRELPPFWGAGLRFALAALLLFALVALLRLALPRGGALAGALLYGLLGFGGFYAFAYWGLLRAPAGVASLVLASVPLLTLIFAWLHRLERVRASGLAGALLAMVGIGVIFTSPANAAVPLVSLLALVAGAACAAEASVVVKLFPQSHPVTTNAVGMTGGAGFLLLLSLSLETQLLPSAAMTWAVLVYLVVFGSLALFVLYLFVLGRWTASAVSYSFVLFPLVAVTVSAWLEHEPLTPGLFLGGACVLAGVYFGALAHLLTAPAAAKEAL